MGVLVPLAVALPLLAAGALVGLASFTSRRVADTAAIGVAAATAVAGALIAWDTTDGTIVRWVAGWQPVDGVAPGVALVGDPLSGAMVALTGVLATAALVYSWRYFDAVAGLFHGMVLAFLGGMVGFALSADLFNLFVFFELMSVAAYALTAYRIEETGPIQGALNFAVTITLSAFLFLFAVGLLYARTGALNLADIAASLRTGPPDALVVTALALVTAGLFTKAAVVPFHFWHADAQAVAPTPISVLLAGAMVQLGVFVWARVYWVTFAEVLADATPQLRTVLVSAGAVTAVVAAIMCYTQVHLKRQLAFATVSHGGITMIGVGLLDAEALAGALLYLVSHALALGALYLCVGILLHRHHSVIEVKLRGAATRQAYTGAVFALGGLAIAGLPPFGTALGKQLIESVAKHHGFAWAVLVIVAASVLTGGAVLRAAGRVFVGLGPGDRRRDLRESDAEDTDEQETKRDTARTPTVMWAPAAVLVAGALAVGLVPSLAHHAEQAAARFVDAAGQRRLLMEGVELRHVDAPSTWWHRSGVAYGLLAAVGAVYAGYLGLVRRHLDGRVRELTWSVIRLPLYPLRLVHSGDVRDYVAWLVVGTALFGGLFWLAV